MADVTLKHIFKAYYFEGREKRKALKNHNETYFLAVKDFNLQIKDGEFVVFVGPSGCGKSTTLRMIAGLEDISQGELYIGDRLVNDVSPKDRNIAMVFQNYALYPHMTCYQNIAFALKLRKKLVKVLDKEGKPVVGINKRVIKELEKEKKAINETILKTQDDPKLNQLYVDKLNKVEKDLEYYKVTPVELDKYRHFTKQEIKEKVEHAAEILDLTSQLDKKPGAMSGGQRQRVALGRAIVREPQVFLLDEPLSNLDAKLRGQMRVEIANLHKKLGTTFVYVTHDQIEAMTMGDRIVVMNKGIVQQIDTPTNLFDYPANVFVAGFIGTPQMNFYKGTIHKEKEDIVIEFENGEIVRGKENEFKGIKKDYLTPNKKEIIIGARSEHIYVDEKSPIKVHLDFVESLGIETMIYAHFDKKMDSFVKGTNDLIIKLPIRANYDKNQEIHISFAPRHLHLFDINTEESINVKK